jgi:rhamnogalacturonan endolyase
MMSARMRNVAVAGVALLLVNAPTAFAQRQMEALGRGLVAIRGDDGAVFVGWRLLGTDPDDIAFNLYRSTGGAAPAKLNPELIRDATNYVDRGANPKEDLSYLVRAVRDGRESVPGAPSRLPADAPARPYLSIPLQTLPGHTPNDASVGDLDGDGEYEIVLKQEMRGRDNSQAGRTGETKLEAYTLGGHFLWRINLGKNIREGAHYTQFMVYDLDGDGKAEVVCKTADGTVDGAGTVIGDAEADHRNAAGFILEGPEFLTVFEGSTGKALATTDYIPPRGGDGSAWGDNRGNRVDRFLGAVAYLDGSRPSVIMCRGYYTRTVLAAWNWRGGKLSNVWTFDSDDGTPGNRAYRGQGNHNLRVGDVDGDGKDEIVYGACVIDDDGKGLYSTGLGHGDAIHLSDIDPDRPGMEVFDIHERPRHPNGAEFRDAKTGALIWGKPSPDVGRGLAIDIDPRHRGYEMWASGQGLTGLWNVKGETVSERKPRSCNFGVWWDGDLLRELLDSNRISKWNWRDSIETNLVTAAGCASNNSTKSTPCLCADILGDWREEVIWRTTDGKELRIYTTTIPTAHRLSTLMHDPIYRLSVAYQNVGYNQPTQTGFYLGDGMSPPPRPAIVTGDPIWLFPILLD